MRRSEATILDAVPLAMAAICVAYGFDLIGAGASATYFTAGHVVLFLAAICFALFCTAMTIIQQLLGHYRAVYRWTLPRLGYAVALGTVGAGIAIAAADANPEASLTTGFVVLGIGLIAACVSTVAAASTKFMLIPRNSRATALGRVPDGFGGVAEWALIAVPVACAVAGIAVAVVLLAGGGSDRFVAGHVLLGLSLICVSLVALVATVARQASNDYRPAERRAWPLLVVAAGSVNVVWGLVLAIAAERSYWLAPGWVMIGLGLVCFSILSKVLLLALVWRRSFALANRIPLIPIGTALACLFLSAFLFQAAVDDPDVAIPARVLVGLGGVCFTLFSIVSILESGTSGD